MKSGRGLVLLALVLGGARGSLHAHRAIYGHDDRQDLFEAPADQAKLAESTVALFFAADVSTDPVKGTAKLKTTSLEERTGLCDCDGERFRDQPTGAYCSGALVGPDLVLTAGHCMRGDPEDKETDADRCRETKFVFGFGINKEGADPTTVPAGNVYGCREVVRKVVKSTGTGVQDWAIVRLDRIVEGRKALAVSASGEVKKGASVFMIGHPSGLPTKVAGNSKVRTVHDTYFVSNLDSFKGNSGSPVFDDETDEIVGVQVWGSADFMTCYDCKPDPHWMGKSTVFDNDKGPGEAATRTSLLAADLKSAREATQKAIEEKLKFKLAEPKASKALDQLKKASEPR